MVLFKFFVVSLIFFVPYVSSVNASDLLREKRMADEIVDAIIDGDALYLKADGHMFLNIYTEADEAKGTVVILHGRGFHPDWQDTISPLRVGLSDAGWNTLSVQMPVLHKEAKYFDYVPLFAEATSRIDAVLKYVHENNSGKVIMVAHSCGAHMAMSWIDGRTGELSNKIDAFVGIGMGATDYQQPMIKPFPYKKMTVPVLDVYGEEDYPGILKMAAERIKQFKKTGAKNTKQVIVEDANHYYEDRGEALTQVVSDWLNSL